MRSESSATPRPRKQSASTPAKKKILVADDLSMSRELMREALEKHGFQVAEASDGGETLREAYAHKPDLILLDIDMPVLDGYAVVKRLRQDPEFAELPIIAITGLSSKEHRERAYDAGCSSFLRKPFNISNMIEEIDCFLGTDPGAKVEPSK